MTKNEIKAYVSRNIEGQGTNVDAGSVLPRILNGIVDAMTDTHELDDFEEFSESTNYSVGDIVRYDGSIYEFTSLKSAGAWDTTKVSATSVLEILSDSISSLEADVKTLEDLHIAPEVTISALSSSTMTVEQAATAGFDTEVIAFLQAAHAPTLKFSDMCLTFNNVIVASDTLVYQTAVFMDSSTSKIYKASLGLNTSGAVTYSVTEIV